MTDAPPQPRPSPRISIRNLTAVCALLALLFPLLLMGKLLVVAGVVGGLALAIGICVFPVAGLAALILASTCFQVLGSATITGLPMSLARLFGVLTTIAFVLTAFNRRLALSYAPQMRALAVFLIVVAVWVLIMPDRAQSLIGLMKIGQAALLYFLVANLAAERWSLRVVCITIVMAAAIASITATVEHYVPSFQIAFNDPKLRGATLGGVVDEESAESGSITRVTGGIGDANYLAYTLAASIPMSLYWWRTTRSSRVRFLVLTLTVLQCAGLVFSYTRTGFLALGVATLYLMLRRRLPLVPILLLGAVVGAAAAYWMAPEFKERFFSARYYREGSTPMRRDMYWAGWQMFQMHPVIGYGYGQFGPEFLRRLEGDRTLKIGDSAPVLREMVEKGYEDKHDLRCHNTYLEVAIEYGLIGFFPFAILLWRVLRDLKPVEEHGTEQEMDLAVCLTAGLLAFYVCGMFGHAKILNIFWILAGTSVALRRITLERMDISSTSLQST